MRQPQFPRPKIEIAVSDIDEELQGEPREVSRLFRKLPRELWSRHFKMLQHIESENAKVDVETLARKKSEYLSTVLEARRAGLEEYESNDPRFSETLTKRELGFHLQELLESPEETLGFGKTARVKRLSLPDGSTAAVKYLLTPTEKTLSAEGEHDMLCEVETITRIEVEEKEFNAGQRVRVPHPFFFYKNEKLQCYGMQEIMGMTIEKLLDTDMPNTVALVDRREAVLKKVRERYARPEEREALFEELELFARAMHNVCLLGDIKPANLMIDERGDIYLIDFGQSVDMNLMTETTREQFENLQILERQQLVAGVRKVLPR